MRLIPGRDPESIVIGILIRQRARCIDQPVLEHEIPVRPDVLSMEYADELLRLARQHITKLRIRLGRIVELGLVNRESIYIEGMETRIEAGLHPRRKRKITRGRSEIAEIDPVIRSWDLRPKIQDVRIQVIQPAGIQVTIMDGYGIVLPVNQRIRPLLAAAATAAETLQGILRHQPRSRKKYGHQYPGCYDSESVHCGEIRAKLLIKWPSWLYEKLML